MPWIRTGAAWILWRGRISRDSEMRRTCISSLPTLPATSTCPPLDGAVMANSLHYFKDKEKVLRHVRTLLKPGGALLLVEYNVDSGNLWVPHPLTFETYRALAPRAGFSEPRLLAKHPSSFLREFYSAVAFKWKTEH